MRARINAKGYKDPVSGKTLAVGTVVDGKVARLAFTAGAAERWGPVQRKKFANEVGKVGSVVKEGLD